MKTMMIAKGILNISDKEHTRKIFVAWNSTNEMRKRALQQEFCPINCEIEKKVSRFITF